MALQPYLVPNLSACRRCRVFGNGSQQGFRCETSKSLANGHQSAADVLLFFNAASEALAIHGRDADRGMETLHQEEASL